MSSCASSSIVTVPVAGAPGAGRGNGETRPAAGRTVGSYPTAILVRPRRGFRTRPLERTQLAIVAAACPIAALVLFIRLIAALHRERGLRELSDQQKLMIGRLRPYELRQEAGYSQRELAAELGISQRRVSYHEGETDYPPAGVFPTSPASSASPGYDQKLWMSPAQKDGGVPCADITQHRDTPP